MPWRLPRRDCTQTHSTRSGGRKSLPRQTRRSIGTQHWIRHHLDVSRQLAVASPFPLLSHVFAGDWDFAFEVLMVNGTLQPCSVSTPISCRLGSVWIRPDDWPPPNPIREQRVTRTGGEGGHPCLGRLGVAFLLRPRRSGRPFRIGEIGRIVSR